MKAEYEIQKENDMKKKADYQKMLLKMIRPLTRHYTDDGSGLYLGAFSAGYGN